MKKIILLLLLAILQSLQSQVFKINQNNSILFISAALSFDLLNNYADRKIIDIPSENQLAELSKSDLPSFDRLMWNPYSTKQKSWSDYSAYLSLGIAAYLGFDDYYWKDNLMVLSQVLITQSAICKWTKTITQRYRPFVYDEDISISKKQERKSQHSFYSLHSSTAFAAATFAYYFQSQIGGKNLPLALLCYTPATVTAVLRVTSGNHFFSDVLCGAIAGSAISYLVCNLNRSENFSLSINYDSLSLSFHF
jgi:hypothetical protein